MAPELKHRFLNKKNIVPIIIDWYIWKPIDIKHFVECYSNNPFIIVTNRQVFDFLKDCDIIKAKEIKVKHLALSISDKYSITSYTRFDKSCDVIAIGRQNHVLSEYMQRYIKKHPNINYIYGEKQGDTYYYTSSRKGYLGAFRSRSDFFDLMKSSRVALYSTAGEDEEYQDKYHGFHQVTPRFLEYIASGCHVISRFGDNSDTDYFQLTEMSYRVESYEEFERTLDRLLLIDVDMCKYSLYLKHHYTSIRAKELKSIIQSFSYNI